MELVVVKSKSLLACVPDLRYSLKINKNSN